MQEISEKLQNSLQPLLVVKTHGPFQADFHCSRCSQTMMSFVSVTSEEFEDVEARMGKLLTEGRKTNKGLFWRCNSFEMHRMLVTY